MHPIQLLNPALLRAENLVDMVQHSDIVVGIETGVKNTSLLHPQQPKWTDKSQLPQLHETWLYRGMIHLQNNVKHKQDEFLLIYFHCI